MKKTLFILLVLALVWSSQMLTAQSVVLDDSDGPFSVFAKMVTVLSPNGGENWNNGETHNITWNLSASIAFVNIDYSTNGGYNWNPVAVNIANSGSYAWTVQVTPSLNCRVRVSDPGNVNNNDSSDAVFLVSVAAVESVSTPTEYIGPGTGLINTGYSFSNGAAESSLWHDVQYKFEWGDGSDSGWLAIGTTSATHAWAVSGTYQVRAMARCAIHTTVESLWSDTHPIIITDSNTPVLLWNTFLGGSDFEEGRDIATDNSGNIYVTGHCSSTWGNPLRPYSGSTEAFVAKYNAGGVLLWHTFLGGVDSDFGQGISVDIAGNIYVTGSSYATWGNPLNPHGSPSGFNSDAFVAKLNTAGELLWNTFNGYASGWGNDIAAGINGNIYALFGSIVVKYDASGVKQWESVSSLAGEAYPNLTVDNSENIYVGGAIGGDVVVTKFNANGVKQWNTFLGGSEGEQCYGIAIDNSGNIFVIGYSGPWGEPINPNSGQVDAFVAKLSADGIYQWHTFLSERTTTVGYGIDINNNGNIYLTGYSYNPGSNSAAFVAQLDSNGVNKWHTLLGGANSNRAFKINVDISGNIVVIGESSSSWGSPIDPFIGGYDAFITKFGTGTNNYLSVSTPNGGENWTVASSRIITWNSPGTITNVNIDYSLDSGGSWTTLATNIVNTGNYAWTVPDVTSSDCLVRVSDAANSAIYDVSNGVFSIVTAETITVIAPNGGENWNDGESQNITWSSTGTIANVDIDYSLDNGSNWILVAADIANSGTYAWTIPATPSSNCLVSVSDATNANTNDVSNTVFSISAVISETVTAPYLPTGPSAGSTGCNYTFSSGGANSNFSDPLQYRFDWGDGTLSGWLATGTTSAVHVWAVSGTYQVRAMARCATHTNVESPWSETHTITITNSGIPGLQWNTFLGGNDLDEAYGITVDNNGNIYILGDSNSTWGSPLNPFAGENDVFVAKFNASGVLQWHTFLGGSSTDFGNSIAVDSSGNIYVAGESSSTWGSPLNPYGGGTNDAFVAKLNTNGVLQWHTFLGGNDYDSVYKITNDSSGNIYITGYCSSNWGSPLNPYSGGEADVFVAKLNTSGILQWHTFLGGSLGDYGCSIAVDNNGNILISGESNSTWGNPLNPLSGEDYDAFVAELNSSGILQWNTFLGGSNDDSPSGISVDSFGNIYVSGFSQATWGSPLNSYGGGASDAFVTKLNASGIYQWHTFLGGSNFDYGSGIAVDNSGNIFISGVSQSNWGSPLNLFSGGYYDAFVAKLNANGALQWNTFLGGNKMDFGQGIALYGSENIYVTGLSDSSWGSPLNPYSGGNYDAFVAKLHFSTNSLSVTAPNGGENWISGTAQNITWSSTGAIVNVNIDYSTDSGSNWTPVATTIANSGTFSWTVPATPSTNCMVRISDAANAAVFDVSNVKFTISVATSITVISPNGGEQWQRGTTQTITWTSSGVANIKIELLKGTTVNKTITTSTPAAAGSYTWAISSTQTAGTDYKIRITSTSSSTVTDSSNAGFTIFIPSITVTAPAAGNAWIRGTSKNITWTVQGTVNANVKIQLFKGTTKTLDITTSTPTANGTFTWNIPSNLTTATNYAIKVITLDNQVTGTSGTFSIVTGIIIVTAPAAGTNWQRGVAHAITWTKEGTLNANVKIQLYKGTALDSTIVSTTPNNGSYNWTIPASKTLATNYKIRVTTADSLVTSYSGIFSITNTAGLTLETPNGNERLTAQTAVPINWTVDPSINEVKLEYSRDNGKNWTSAAANVANSGSYTWKVPNTPSTTCLVRASDAANAGTNDISNEVFTIIAGEKAAADFDNNGISDIVWRYYGKGTNEGQNIICLLNADGTGKGKVSLPEISDLNWKICGVGDFNNDGVLDILWRHYGLGINGIWLLNADNTIKSRQPLPALSDLNYQINGVGDFNNDGVLDILWRHYGSTNYPPGGTPADLVCLSKMGSTNHPTPQGEDQICLSSMGSGKNLIWLMNADHTILSRQALIEVSDVNWKICAVGDFNRDGVLDILWRHYSLGLNYLWLMNADHTILSGQALPEMIDLKYKISGVGDFNGDGILDVIWRHYDSGRSGVWLMNGDYSLSAWRPLPAFPDVRMSDLNWQITNNNNNDTIVNSSASSTLTAADSLEIEQMTETSKSNAGDDASSQLSTNSLQIMSPNSGENWRTGTMHDISWNTIGPIPNVTIDYSLDNGKSWMPVAVNTVNSGAYVWNIPAAISANCLLRISDSTNSKIVDASDGIFSISSSAMETVSTPRQPSGIDMGLTNTSYSFTSGSANSNFGDAMQYKFDWGDGSDSGWLAAGTISAAHTWTSSGIYHVRAMARTKKTNVESSWSTAHDIIMAAGINEAKTNH